MVFVRAILSCHDNYLCQITIELQRLEFLWDHEKVFETEVVRANEVNHSAMSGGITGIFFAIFFDMKVCCVFSLESPHRGDSN